LAGRRCGHVVHALLERLDLALQRVRLVELLPL
jgi:hypothetical protein